MTTYIALQGSRVLTQITTEDTPESSDLEYVEYTGQINWEQPTPTSELRLVSGVCQWVETGNLANIKAAQWESIKAHRSTLDNAPITITGGIQLDGDEKSRNDILGSVVAMQLGGAATRNWRCADNVLRTLTLTQIVEAGLGIASRRQSLIETSDALYHQIYSANTDTPAKVKAINWPN